MPKITKLCLNLSELCGKYCGLFFSGHDAYNRYVVKFGDISCVVCYLLQVGAGFKKLNFEPSCEYPVDPEENQRLGESIH